MNNLITVLTASRRFEGYKKMLESVEKRIPDLIDAYVVMVDNPETLPLYKELKLQYPKIKILSLPYNWIYKNGFAALQNLLLTSAKSKYSWLLFDTDTLDTCISSDEFGNSIDQKEMLEIDLAKDADAYAYNVFMERASGNFELKTQLFKTDCVQFTGLVHEHLQFKYEPKILRTTGLTVYHMNAVDAAAKNVKIENEIKILEPYEEGSDSYLRDRLYEFLTYRIIHEGLPHPSLDYLKRHYERNKQMIDSYYIEGHKYCYKNEYVAPAAVESIKKV